MAKNNLDIKEFHWLMDILQTIDVGLVVLDREYKVVLWNSFMENHSAMRPDQVKEKVLFSLFPEVPEAWFKKKAEAVFLLKTRAFTIWEQRPYLFKFKNYRPITGRADFMYQNSTIIPLESSDGQVNHICLIIYDQTDTAINKHELKLAHDRLEHLSRTDRLTELFNRGHWEECLEQEFKRCQRTLHPCSLVIFDIDHFKKVNDTYGHQAGDEVIRQVAQSLRKIIRVTDIAGRYGGEEFVTLLIETEPDTAMNFAERLRQHVENLVLKIDGQEIRFTISLGISAWRPDFKNRQQWLESADKALYESKHGGRNRTTLGK